MYINKTNNSIQMKEIEDGLFEKKEQRRQIGPTPTFENNESLDFKKQNNNSNGYVPSPITISQRQRQYQQEQPPRRSSAQTLGSLPSLPESRHSNEQFNQSNERQLRAESAIENSEFYHDMDEVDSPTVDETGKNNNSQLDKSGNFAGYTNNTINNIITNHTVENQKMYFSKNYKNDLAMKPRNSRSENDIRDLEPLVPLDSNSSWGLYNQENSNINVNKDSSSVFTRNTSSSEVLDARQLKTDPILSNLFPTERNEKSLVERK
eukprot:UN24871